VMTFFEATSSLTKKYSGTSGTGILPRRVGLSIGVALGHSLARSHFIDFVYSTSLMPPHLAMENFEQPQNSFPACWPILARRRAMPQPQRGHFGRTGEAWTGFVTG